MADDITLRVDGRSVTVPGGVTVATAVAMSGVTAFRRSVDGEPRAPLCGMGVCAECQVTLDGRAHRKSCQVLCRAGMDVRTDG